MPILFSASILPEDNTADSLIGSIITFSEEKKEWLHEWKRVIERDFEDYDHNIEPGGGLENATTFGD